MSKTAAAEFELEMQQEEPKSQSAFLQAASLPPPRQEYSSYQTKPVVLERLAMVVKRYALRPYLVPGAQNMVPQHVESVSLAPMCELGEREC